MIVRNDAAVDALRETLSELLPGADLVETALPLVPELSLYLLDGSYPQSELSAEQVQRIMNYPAYWCFCWASGQVMARYLLDNPALVAGRRVLDFGAGSGVAGIAAALAGATEVVLCDLDPDALQVCGANAALNRVDVAFSDDFFASDTRWDVILVADVLYDRANLPLLDVFRQRADIVLVADSRIRDFSVPGFQTLSTEHACTVPDLAESEEFSRVTLYLSE